MTNIEQAKQRLREDIRLCGCCDAGLSMNCTCSTRDQRRDIAWLVDDHDALKAALERALRESWVVNIVQRIAPTEFSAVFASDEEALAFVMENYSNGTWARDWLRVQTVKAHNTNLFKPGDDHA